MSLYFDPDSCRFHLHNNSRGTLTAVSRDLHAEIMRGIRSGKVVGNASGDPVLHDAPAASREQVEAAAWTAIKAERDRRALGGFSVGGYWFHGDAFSRSQHLGMKDQARDILAAGGSQVDPLIADGEEVQWKSMSGEFVLVTVQLAFAIVQAAADADARVFRAAEAHLAAMRGSADPAAYDFSAGWPAIYGEA